MMKQAIGLSAALLICMAGAASARGNKEAKVTEKERAQLDELAQKYERAFNQSDPDAVAQLYTRDGSMMDTMGQTAKGQDEIRTQLQQSFQEQTKGAKIDVTVADITPIDEKTVMVDSRFQITGAQQEHANGPGHAVVIARREGKQWKVMSSRAFMTPQMQQGVGGAGAGDMGSGRDEMPQQPPKQPTDMSQPRGDMPPPPTSPDMQPQPQNP